MCAEAAGPCRRGAARGLCTGQHCTMGLGIPLWLTREPGSQHGWPKETGRLENISGWQAGLVERVRPVGGPPRLGRPGSRRSGSWPAASTRAMHIPWLCVDLCTVVEPVLRCDAVLWCKSVEFLHGDRLTALVQTAYCLGCTHGTLYLWRELPRCTGAEHQREV